MSISRSGLVALALAGTVAGCADRTSAQADGGTSTGDDSSTGPSTDGATGDGDGGSGTEGGGESSGTEGNSGSSSDEACIERQKLVPPQIGYDQYFGTSVAISDETAVVGSYYHEAYVYARDANGTWKEQAVLRGEGQKRVSSLVSIDQDTIAVIGTEGDQSEWWSYVFVFERDNEDWAQVAELTAPDGAHLAFENGAALSIWGDTIVAGDSANPQAGVRSGAAYVFERDESGVWTETQVLTASDPAEHEYFGESVGLSSDTLVVGAHLDSVAGIASGSVYVFTRDDAGTWNEVTKLAPVDGTENHRFGKSVGISGGTMVVGAHGDNDRSGSAYVFERDDSGAWDGGTKLTAPDDGEEDERFGCAVATSGDKVVVGAYWDDDAGAESGSVYVFTRNPGSEWTQLSKLIGSDIDDYDSFGGAVAISGSTVVIGAYGDEYYAGAAYLFECP